jgi:large subunit ribosomal protein L17
VRHGKKGRQLSRDSKHRWALFRNLVTSLLDCERIETTEQKAKEIRGYAERMITLGKQGDLDSRRQALRFIRSKTVVAKLFNDVAGRFRDRNGGYTRMIKTRRRVGDAASMVALELVVKSGVAASQTSGQTASGKTGSEASKA